MKEVKLYLNYAGYCYAKEKYAIKGGRNEKIKFHALFGLILHPEQGWILYDTGYTSRFYEATKKYPNKIYAKNTEVVINPEDEVKSQLKNFNIDPQDIKHIIISHFHADHVCGLKDFDNATFYCSAAAYRQICLSNSFWGFSKGYLKDLIPAYFNKRVTIIKEFAIASSDKIFTIKYDLFGDDSIHIYPLPGHAAGQIGIEIKTSKQKYFLIADACWLKRSYEEMILPHPIVRLICDSWKDYVSTLKKVHSFHKKFPEVIIVPTHCEASTSVLVSDKYDMDAL